MTCMDADRRWWPTPTIFCCCSCKHVWAIASFVVPYVGLHCTRCDHDFNVCWNQTRQNCLGSCVLFYSTAEGDCWACGSVKNPTIFWGTVYCHNCEYIDTAHGCVPRWYWSESKDRMEELMGRSVRWRRVAPDVEFRESVGKVEF